MKIALAQLNFHTGNFEQNTKKIVDNIRKAKDQGADLVVFPELAITGYPPRDFLEFEHFLEMVDRSIEIIAGQCHDVAAIVGAPSINPRVQGKNLFNSAFFLADGSIKQIYSKTLLPTYDVFDEYRYFEPVTENKCISYKGKKIALTICEDIWDLQDDPLYNVVPMDELLKQQPDVMINIAASPFSWKHDERRKNELRKNTRKYNLPLFYVNHVGAQTEIVFDGNSTVVNASGEIWDVMSTFEEDLRVYNLDEVKNSEPHRQWQPQEKYERIFNALVLGVKDYFKKQGFKKAILGSSGGIDSAVVQAVASAALGGDNVLAVLMPSMFTADMSNSYAARLSENLGNPYKKIAIEKPYNAFNDILQEHFEGKPFDVTEENLQSRSRGIIVMALSNKLGHILLNTSNKSELAVGYGTLYGDMAGGISVIGDVYKTEVYALARYINRDREIIPEGIIVRPPSAELRPDQTDQDSLPPYDILDKILYQYIEERRSPGQIIDMGFEKPTVERVLSLVNRSEFKRHQTPPILRVSDKAFGMGRRMPIVAKYLC